MNDLNWIEAWAEGPDHQKVLLHEKLHAAILNKDASVVDEVLQQMSAVPTMVGNTNMSTLVMEHFDPLVAQVCVQHGMVVGHKSLWSSFIAGKPSVLEFAWNASDIESKKKMMELLVKNAHHCFTNHSLMVCLEKLFSYSASPSLLAQVTQPSTLSRENIHIALSSGSPKYVVALLSCCPDDQASVLLLNWISSPSMSYSFNSIAPHHIQCLRQALQQSPWLQEQWKKTQEFMRDNGNKMFEMLDEASQSHEGVLNLIKYERRREMARDHVTSIPLPSLWHLVYEPKYLDLFEIKNSFVPASVPQALWLSASLAWLEYKKQNSSSLVETIQWLDHPYLRRRFAESMANQPENMLKILRHSPEMVQWRSPSNQNVFHELVNAQPSMNWNLSIIVSLAKIAPDAFMEKDDEGKTPYDRAKMLSGNQRETGGEELLDQALLKSSLKNNARSAKSAPSRKM